MEDMKNYAYTLFRTIPVGTTLRTNEKFYFLDVCKPAATEQEKIRKHRVCLRILF